MNQTEASRPLGRPGASSLLAVTYPGRSPEGAKAPLPGGPKPCISVRLFGMKTALCPGPPGLWREVRPSPAAAFPLSPPGSSRPTPAFQSCLAPPS